MRTYYIYMLELTDGDSTKKFYIGKTHQLEKRLQDHIKGNRKSAKKLKGHEVKSIKEIHLIKRIEDLEEKLQDSVTSRIENRFITNKILENGGSKSNYRGGCYLLDWENNNFNLLDVKNDRYNEELKGYSLEKLTMIEYDITSQNKDTIVQKIMSDIL